MTVAELLSRISSAELGEWQAYFALAAEEAGREALARRAEQAVIAAKRRRRR